MTNQNTEAKLGSIKLLKTLVDADIERNGESSSTMVRAGLLRDIIALAMQSANTTDELGDGSDFGVTGEWWGTGSDELVERVAEVIAPHLRTSYFNPDTDDQAEARGFATSIARKALNAIATPDSDRVAVLERALTEAIDVLDGMNDDEINVELLPTLRAALSQPLGSQENGNG